MVNLESILAEWKEDSQISKNQLDEVSRITPALHSKYLEYLSLTKLRLKRAEFDQKNLLKEKWLYYTGKADPDTYIDKPFDHKVIRQDMDMYLGSDDDLIKIQSKMDYYQVMLNYLDSILKSITNRTYQIKNAIEWQKFIRGYSD